MYKNRTQNSGRPQTLDPEFPLPYLQLNGRQHARHLWDQPSKKNAVLGCSVCSELGKCGGLQLDPAAYDCLEFCCRNSQACAWACPNQSNYVDKVREIGGFGLENIPRAPELTAPDIPRLVPIIYHRNSRQTPAECGAVALPLYKFFDRSTKSPCFTKPVDLFEAFCIQPNVTILLTGIAKDPPLERWWLLGESRRLAIIRAMKSAGVGLVTTPNYSLVINRPRQDNLHAIKRIGIVHEEFLREGVPAALHTNGRTQSDFDRWSTYINARSEVTHIAYEFATGPGRSDRLDLHTNWLVELAKSVDRPLHLIVRGGKKVLPILFRAYAQVTFLDTSIFIKTIKRQRASRRDDGTLSWIEAPTEPGAPVDNLFTENFQAVSKWMDEQKFSIN